MIWASLGNFLHYFAVSHTITAGPELTTTHLIRDQINLNIRFVMYKSECWSQILADKYIGRAPIVFSEDPFYVIDGRVDGNLAYQLVEYVWVEILSS